VKDVDKIVERLILGHSAKKLYRVPTPDQVVQRLGQKLLSSFDSEIALGWNEDEGEVLLTQEERQSNIHILGMPGEGKSMLMQLLMRADIDRLLDKPEDEAAPGMCLIDGSDSGDTAKKVLKYCCDKGYNKVLVVDAYDMFEYMLVPCIAPFAHHSEFRSENLVLDTIQSSWGQEWNKNANIRRYSTALTNCLYNTGYTLAESKWFLDQNKLYERQRERILTTQKVENGKTVPCLPAANLNRVTIESAYRNAYVMYNTFLTTINRFTYFCRDKMELVVGSKTGIDFKKLITDGYVILAVLDGSTWGREAQTILGTLLINEIIFSKEELEHRANPYTVPYHLYIDEVGHFATPKLAEVIDLKRKMNLWVCSAHQRWGQIKDPDLESALYSTPISVVFNCENPDDRLKMVRKMFGGDIGDREAQFALKDTPAREAWIDIQKRKPLKVAIEDVHEPDCTDEEFETYKRNVVYNLSINPHYRPLAEVRGEINNRLAQAEGTNTKKFTGGKPVRPEGDSNTRPDAQPGHDEHPNVEAGPVDEGRDFQLPRRRQRQEGVLPSLIHKSEQDAGPLDVPGPASKRKQPANRRKAKAPKETPDGGV
jgi:hypothetical protein